MRLIDIVYHSTPGLRVIKKKRETSQIRRGTWTSSGRSCSGHAHLTKHPPPPGTDPSRCSSHPGTNLVAFSRDRGLMPCTKRAPYQLRIRTSLLGSPMANALNKGAPQESSIRTSQIRRGMWTSSGRSCWGHARPSASRIFITNTRPDEITPPALRAGSSRLLQALDLYWRPLESFDMWHESV